MTARWLPAGALALGLLLLAAVLPAEARSDRWQVRKEMREGARNVEREKREAQRALRRCETRECARREMREGYREVEREKREARREIRGAMRDSRWEDERWRDRRDRDDDHAFLKGALVGAALVGVTAAIIEANDDD